MIWWSMTEKLAEADLTMARPMHRKIITVADPAALANVAADRVLARIAAKIRPRVAICLAGGSTRSSSINCSQPRPIDTAIPWDRVHWFVGDERFVPAADPLSNIEMMRDAFLDSCAPIANIHPIATDSAGPDEAAHRYERELKSFYGATVLDLARPLFDVVLMGDWTGRPYRVALSRLSAWKETEHGCRVRGRMSPRSRHGSP